MENLPYELYFQIFSQLDAFDLLALTATSRVIRRVTIQERLWQNLLGSRGTFFTDPDFRNDFRWRHAAMRLDPAEQSDEHFTLPRLLTTTKDGVPAKELAKSAAEYLPWAVSRLRTRKDPLFILSTSKDSILAYNSTANKSAKSTATDTPTKHDLLLLRNGKKQLILSGLPGIPTCAAFIDHEHVLVCGNFDKALLWHVDRPGSPFSLPLSTHVVNSLSMRDPTVSKQILLCGNYKGRGAMELLQYALNEAGEMTIEAIQENRVCGITNIAHCTYLSGGSFITYDDFQHIYLWSTLHNAIRKVNHDLIAQPRPYGEVYKMHYAHGYLVFIDQGTSSFKFAIRPGRKLLDSGLDTKSEMDEDERDSEERHSEEQTKPLFQDKHKMLAVTRSILGI